MDLLLLFKAFVMGIVEGLTEFLPISSTGHLIVTGSLIGFDPPNAKTFEIVIQAAAIFAVVWEYRARIAAVLGGLSHDPKARLFAINVCIAFLPAAVLGVAFNHKIKQVLFAPVPVAMAFIVGAFVILWAEARNSKRVAPNDAGLALPRARVESVDDMTLMDAVKVGCAQAFGLIPGTSRSGATIIGAMLFGLSRKAATEFSFFLAIPTLFGATVYSLYKERNNLAFADVPLIGVGSLAAFLAAFFCVRWLLRYISTHDFSMFAWYRIAFGFFILGTDWLSLVRWAE